ncbi:acyl-malonyl condensing enzyme-related [Anaeramoeba flamelloides]|uniref:Acyl-malonyl condensing enzyme-related n=1 Tax=Anaeramoeba flamelloides TaxID=1746091 RepID=A0AAV7Y438_9EUKA|nr:acyl-malonyl condensing enzyme-related [Anaeramoeba flamelloides]KAJ6229518.1 acyl-malonyl condensing enzyme-related [Anaeramoeba flamelloides]
MSSKYKTNIGNFTNLKYSPGVLLVHSIFGLYAVLLRYLQKSKKMPNFVLGAMASLVAFLSSSLILITSKKRIKTLMETLKDRNLWFLVFFAAARSITLFGAAKYSPAPYIVLVTNLSPFMVAVIAKIFLSERLPKYIFQSLFLILVGVILIGFDEKGSFYVNLRAIWGIVLVFLSSISLAIYLILVRVLTLKKKNGFALIACFELPIAVLNTILSLSTQQDWTTLGDLGVKGVFAFIGVSLGVIFFGNYCQIWLISKIGAAFVSSLLAWRVIVSVIFSNVLLKEDVFKSVYQIIGWCMIIVVLFAFLMVQAARAYKEKKNIGINNDHISENLINSQDSDNGFVGAKNDNLIENKSQNEDLDNIVNSNSDTSN